MEEILSFRLTGIGHLEGIDTRDEGVYARICVIHPAFGIDNIKLEDVVLHCVIDKSEWLLLLQKLEKQRQKGHSIILKFQVAYAHFGVCHYGMGEDPRQLVQFYTKLLRVDGWYLDGHWTNTGDPTDAALILDKAA